MFVGSGARRALADAHTPRPAQVGEHAGCGPGNLPCSGFTYRPEYFMASGIGVANIPWRDLGVPTLGKMMDIVQVARARWALPPSPRPPPGAPACDPAASSRRAQPSAARAAAARQVMQRTVGGEGRKVAVHCHAGLGRTGLVASCYLVYAGEAR